MSITDELREWASNNTVQDKVLTTYPVQHLVHGTVESLLAIADRIDAAHEEAIQREHESAYDAGYDDGYASADDWCAQHEDAMAEHGWVRLPKDADGECIHIGDVMDGVNKYDTLQEVTGTVTTISFDATLDPNDSTSVGIRVWADDHKSYRVIYIDPYASVYRHHKHPTVEDVLEELLLEYDRDDSEVTIGEIIERFAAKLQLRGDE